MRTLIVILAGLALLGLSAMLGRSLGGDSASIARAAIYFIPLWLVVAVINLWVGVRSAGYSLAEETPIFLAIFLIPTAIAVLLWWKLTHF